MKSLLWILVLCGFAKAAPIGFETAIEKIIARSTQIGTAQANLQALEGANLPTKLTYLPSLSVEASHFARRPFRTNSTASSRSVEATGQLNLFKFGADRAAIGAAKAQEQAAEHNISDSVLKVEFQAVSALTAYIASEKKLRILRDLVEIRNDALVIARERYQKGLLPEQEVSMVSIDLDNTLARQRDTESERIQALARLEELLGQGYEVETSWPWKRKFAQSPLLKSSITQLKNRPDMKSSEKSLAAAEYSLDNAWGNIFPSLDLIASYGYTDSISTGLDGTNWSAGVVLSIPLFDKLANYGTHQQRVHQKTRARINLEQTRRDSRKEWESAKGSFRISLDTAISREKTLKLSEKLYQDNIERFKRGRINANDLQLELTRVIDARLNEVSGWQQAHVSYTQLCHSVGNSIVRCLKEEPVTSPPSK